MVPLRETTKRGITDKFANLFMQSLQATKDEAAAENELQRQR